MLLRLVSGFAFAFAMIAGQAAGNGPCQPSGTVGGCPPNQNTTAPTNTLVPSPLSSPYPTRLFNQTIPTYSAVPSNPGKSPSPDPSRSPIPSDPGKSPIPSPDPSRSSIPSDPGKSPSPDSTRSPTPSSDPTRSPPPSTSSKPDSSRSPIPSYDPSRSPPPSTSSKPDSSPIPSNSPAKSPPPSSSPLPSKNPPKPSPVPAPGAVQFKGANVTRVQDPNYLGQVQGLLGCTYNVPFNNINITNMTHTDATGIHTLTVPSVSYVNYTCGTAGLTPRLLRELQAVDSVTINYIVFVDPAYNLTDITTLLQSSPYSSTMVSAFGATGLSVPETNSGLAAVPGSTINGSSSSSLYAEVFGSVGAVLALSIFAIAGVWAYSIRQRNANMVKAPSQSKVVRLVVEDFSTVATENVLADRRQFDPVNVRPTIHV